MRRLRSSTCVAAIAALAALLACDSSAPTTTVECKVATVSLSPPTGLLESLGDRLTIQAATGDRGGASVPTAVTWTSDAPDIVALEGSGLAIAARAVAPGVA